MSKRKLMGRLGRTLQGRLSDGRRLCGASVKTKGFNHRPCKRIALPNGRCRYHGGLNGGGEKVAKGTQPKFGIYADVALFDTELDVYPDIKNRLGTLDDEIHMARIKLRRIYKAQKYQDLAHEIICDLSLTAEAMEVKLVHLAHSVGLDFEYLYKQRDSQKLTLEAYETYIIDHIKKMLAERKTDYSDEIAKFTSLIHRLEQSRKEILSQNTQGSVDYLRQMAEDLRIFTNAAETKVPTVHDMKLGSGNYPNLGKPTSND